MTKPCKIHSYSDGDVILTVEDTSFQLHISILSLASKVFEKIIGFSVERDLSSGLRNNCACVQKEN
ncbi:16695_t:CDS:2 [Entrophospora sp. SA101]|nr:16695_t:CDS:2 [Entrophospora sp. SA101]